MTPGSVTRTSPVVEKEQSGHHFRSGLVQLFWQCTLAVACFHAAWLCPPLAGLLFVYAALLTFVAFATSARIAFRAGFAVGFCVFAPHLFWFWNIFGAAAICLWCILALFHGLYTLAVWNWRVRMGTRLLWLVAPILWTGLEYFRSELYYLRFSWLSMGYAFSTPAGLKLLGVAGVYGAGFLVFAAGGLLAARGNRNRLVGAVALLMTALFALPVPHSKENAKSRGNSFRAAGIQLEFPAELDIPQQLDKVLVKYPEARLVVLSEYTFDGPPPDRVRTWCKLNQRYLVAGGKVASNPDSNFFNTAFVVGPDGEIVFQQAKSVPIQFFSDGMPATSQEVWESPWGKIGICVCYDLSYRRVTDHLARMGAQAMIIPFMDVAEWGFWQHTLHARVGPARAAEYGIPIFRVGSSGISQFMNRDGEVRASLDYPGQEQMLSAELQLGDRASLPLDYYLGPACAFAIIPLCAGSFIRRRKNLRPNANQLKPTEVMSGSRG